MSNFPRQNIRSFWATRNLLVSVAKDLDEGHFFVEINAVAWDEKRGGIECIRPAILLFDGELLPIAWALVKAFVEIIRHRTR